MNNEWNKQVFDYAQKLTIRCGLGWHGFILNAISELLNYKKNNPEKIADIKFAGKRKGKLYIAVTDDFPVELLEIYGRMERASKRLCEYCGCDKTVIVRTRGGYILTNIKYILKELFFKKLFHCCNGKRNKRYTEKEYQQIIEKMEKIPDRGFGWSGLIMPILLESIRFCRKNPDCEYEMWLKEKWGGIRFESRGGSRAVHDMEIEADFSSDKICEGCGCEGINRPCNTGWVLTLCKDCWIEQDKIPPFWAREEDKNVEQ
jgi:hypothetical protein